MSQPAFEYSKTYTLLRSAVVPFRSPVQTKPAVWANQCGSYSYSWFDCLSLTHLLAHFFSYFFFVHIYFAYFIDDGFWMLPSVANDIWKKKQKNTFILLFCLDVDGEQPSSAVLLHPRSFCVFPCNSFRICSPSAIMATEYFVTPCILQWHRQ